MRHGVPRAHGRRSTLLVQGYQMQQDHFELIGSGAWVQYFRFNAKALLSIPWSEGLYFTDETRAAIASSVQEFQLGESSEGKHLLACARRHAAETGDPAYVEALGLFIAE